MNRNRFYAKVWAGERLRNGKYLWHFRVYNSNGEVIAKHETGDWRKIYDNAYRLARTFNECTTRGIKIEQPKWLKEN